MLNCCNSPLVKLVPVTFSKTQKKNKRGRCSQISSKNDLLLVRRQWVFLLFLLTYVSRDFVIQQVKDMHPIPYTVGESVYFAHF